MTQRGRTGTTAAGWIGRTVVAVELLTLLGWLFAPRAADGGTLTRPGTAVALTCLGVVVGWPRLSAWARQTLLALVPVVAVVGVLAELLSAAAGACLVLLAASLALGPRRPAAMTGASLLAFGVGYVAVLGDLYGTAFPESVEAVTAMAALTAPAMLAMCVAAQLAHPVLPVARALHAPGIAGELVRRFLGWTLLVPPLLVWLIAEAAHRGWVDEEYGRSVTALAVTGGTVVLVLVGARTAARVDRARAAGERKLAVLNAELADRVRAAVEEAEAGRERLRFLLDSTPVGIVETDADGRRLYVNQRWRELAGVADGVGDDWAQVLHPQDRGRVESEWAAAAGAGREYSTRCRYQRPDGNVAWVDLTVVAVRAADGTIVRWLGCVADVTDQVDATAALRRSEQQFRLAMEHAPIGMALVDVDGRFLDVNRALCRIVGYDEEQLVGRTFQQITHPDDLAADLENVARLLDGTLDHYAMEKRFVTRDHDVVWVLLAVSLARDETGRPAYFVSQIQDVTASRAAQELLAHRALHDPLTGLANRDLLMDHLSHALARSARGGTSTAVMFCDLDRFKVVNDTYGHEAGDLLLVAVAERLRSVVRPGDTVARLGGDEFVVVAEGLPDADAVHALAERVRLCLHEPARIGSHIVNAGASIGVAVASAEDDARSVLREADAAMYRAKTLGRGRLEMAAMTGAAIGMVRKAGPVTELDLQGS